MSGRSLEWPNWTGSKNLGGKTPERALSPLTSHSGTCNISLSKRLGTTEPKLQTFSLLTLKVQNTGLFRVWCNCIFNENDLYSLHGCWNQVKHFTTVSQRFRRKGRGNPSLHIIHPTRLARLHLLRSHFISQTSVWQSFPAHIQDSAVLLPTWAKFSCPDWRF